jgi:hypothetical protein
MIFFMPTLRPRSSFDSSFTYFILSFLSNLHREQALAEYQWEFLDL